MKPTIKELEVLRIYALLTHTEDKYVWLRMDNEGTYIEYAFKEGAPHDNRCLAWYHSLQINAMKRNGSCSAAIDTRRIQIEAQIDNIFKLQSFTCGYEEHLEYALKDAKERWEKYHDFIEEPFVEEEHICKVGCPAQRCVKNRTCAHWTYKEPVKCACWSLEPINELPTCVSIPMEDAVRLKDELLK